MYVATKSISVKICSIYRMKNLEIKTQYMYRMYIVRMYIVNNIDIVDTRYNIEYGVQDLDHRR